MRANDNRCNKYCGPKKSSTCPCPGFSQQFGQRPKPIFPEMSQLPAVCLLDRVIESAQQLKPVRRNLCHHDSAVLGFPPARNQPPLFQTIEQPRDIGIARNHAVRNLATGQTLRRTAQNPQHVILRRRQFLGLKHLHEAARQQITREMQIEECCFLRAGRTPRSHSWLNFFHSLIICVTTTIVKTELFWSLSPG